MKINNEKKKIQRNGKKIIIETFLINNLFGLKLF